jgi:hypothetical protein
MGSVSEQAGRDMLGKIVIEPSKATRQSGLWILDLVGQVYLAKVVTGLVDSKAPKYLAG